MCGILGYVGYPKEGQWGETHRILDNLFVESEHRGRHASGFVATTSPFKMPIHQEVVTDKAPLPSSQFIRQNSSWRWLRHRRCSIVLGHVRWATHGDPRDNRNNHPHKGRNGLWMIHNGILSGHREAAASRRLRLTSDCDSEIIIRMVESASHPAQGLSMAMADLRGSMAVAVLDTERQVVWLARNDGRPLWLARLIKNDPRWFFASERKILMNAFEHTLGECFEDHLEQLIPMSPGHIHGLSPLGQLIAHESIR